MRPTPRNPYPQRFHTEDLTGQKFGLLEAKWNSGRVEYGNMKPAMWTCQCECGRYVMKSSDQLKKGRAQTCEVCKIEEPKLGQGVKLCFVVRQLHDSRSYLSNITQGSFAPRMANGLQIECNNAAKIAHQLVQLYGENIFIVSV